MHQLTDLSTQVCTLGPREAKLYFCPVPDVQLWKALHTWCYFKNLFSKQKFGMERKEQVSRGRAHLSAPSAKKRPISTDLATDQFPGDSEKQSS